ncbi:hypothetical protein D3C78_1877040 [compost metagenome]
MIAARPVAGYSQAGIAGILAETKIGVMLPGLARQAECARRTGHKQHTCCAGDQSLFHHLSLLLLHPLRMI